MKTKIVMTNGINSLLESGSFSDKDLFSALVQFTANG